MKPAPVQLLQVMFKKVSVEWDERHAPQEPPNPFTTTFMFDGVDLTTEFSIGELDLNHERGRMYLVSLRLAVDNEPREDKEDQKYSPYLIDVEARCRAHSEWSRKACSSRGPGRGEWRLAAVVCAA